MLGSKIRRVEKGKIVTTKFLNPKKVMLSKKISKLRINKNDNVDLKQILEQEFDYCLAFTYDVAAIIHLK